MRKPGTKFLRRMESGEAVERYITNKDGLAMPTQSVWPNLVDAERDGNASSSSNSVFWPAQRLILNPEIEDDRCRVEKTTNNNPTASDLCWSQKGIEHKSTQIAESKDGVLWQANPVDDVSSPRENSERAGGRVEVQIGRTPSCSSTNPQVDECQSDTISSPKP